MRKTIPYILFVLLAAPALASEPAAKPEDPKTFYAIGVLMHRSVATFQLTPAELESVKQGLTDASAGKAAVDMEVYGPKVQELAKARRKVQGDKLASSNKAFEEKAAKEKGAERTPSGLVYLSLKEGTGKSPGPASTVKVNYRGTLTDGKEFDSSYKRGVPAEFPLNGVIKCFGEGLQKMKVGGKAKLVCPSKIAYGDQGAGDLILPGATLVFEIELLGIKE
jgi:FKBP-type peptidyl-prolyl cis-trans isomerase FkpA